MCEKISRQILNLKDFYLDINAIKLYNYLINYIVLTFTFFISYITTKMVYIYSYKFKTASF